MAAHPRPLRRASCGGDAKRLSAGPGFSFL